MIGPAFNLSEMIQFITGRNESLFAEDLRRHRKRLQTEISGKSVLVLGGAGTIGSSFTKQLLAFDPSRIFVIDNNENELTELVRDIRSQPDIRQPAELVTLPMDFADSIALRLIENEGPFDIVANFAALKHVRSEKNAYCSAYMVKNNVLKARVLLELLRDRPPQHFFCVSTDKAAEPINLMGATKKLMEELVMGYAKWIPATTARFANVAFSNGSLLDGFLRRLAKRQPLAAPNDVRRFFVSPDESGQLCLLACMLGSPGDIFVPNLDATRDTKVFSDIAVALLESIGLEADVCASESEARERCARPHEGTYPCYFFSSDTTGEKFCEQFWTEDEIVDADSFSGISVVRYLTSVDLSRTNKTLSRVESLIEAQDVRKSDIIALLKGHLTRFDHHETHKYLDQRM